MLCTENKLDSWGSEQVLAAFLLIHTTNWFAHLPMFHAQLKKPLNKTHRMELFVIYRY